MNHPQAAAGQPSGSKLGWAFSRFLTNHRPSPIRIFRTGGWVDRRRFQPSDL